MAIITGINRPLHYVLILAVSILAISGCTLPLETPPESPPTTPQSQAIPTEAPVEWTQALVTKVIDGDTIEVAINGQIYRVRYIGVDTPEHGQTGFEEATQYNFYLVAGKVVGLERDVSETDRYGRLLRYVWVEEGMVNALLVADGYAQVATYPPDVKYQQEFLDLQRYAKENKRGLWAISHGSQEAHGDFVGSVNSDKYHYPSCQYAQRIYTENEVWFSSTSEAQAYGYTPCKVCNPP